MGGGILEFRSFYASKICPYLLGRALSDGEIACFASHFCLWQRCVELNEPIMILEDDVVFNDNFTADTIKTIASSSYNYVRLYYIFDKPVFHIYDNFYATFRSVSGAQGYYITPTAAKRFLRASLRWSHPVDDFLDSFGAHGVQTVIYKPFLLSTKAYDSQIQMLGRQYADVPLRYKFTRELYKSFIYLRGMFWRFFKN